MSALSSLIAPLRSSLSDHVGELQANLDALDHRVRESIAQVVSQAVARAVREGITLLLGQRQSALSKPPPLPQRYEPPSRYWDRPDYDDDRGWYDEADDWPETDQRDASVSSRSSVSQPLANADRTRDALAAGCQAVAWWLRSSTRKLNSWSLLGVGLVAGTAALALGRWAQAGATLIGSTLSIFQVIDSTSSWAALLGLWTS